MVELLVVHPGGPFWANKDEHAWSIPKGEIEGEADAEATARREFTEETGQAVPDGPLIALTELSLGGGKRLRAFAVLGDLDADAITGETSNTFEMEWPPRSGRTASFPEVDAGRWVPLDEAAASLHKGQARLVSLLDSVVTETGW